MGFGSNYKKLFESTVKYDDKSLAKATEYIDKVGVTVYVHQSLTLNQMRPDMGGTEIHSPLADIINSPATEGFARSIILLTDGQVSNEDDVVALVRRHTTDDSRTRMFSIGIGSGVSHYLVNEVARVGNGLSEISLPGETAERLTSKVLRLLRFVFALSTLLTIKCIAERFMAMALHALFNT